MNNNYNNIEIVKINKVMLASSLAEEALVLKYPTIHEDEEVYYSDKFQDEFNELYDYYMEFIEGCEIDD